MDPTHVRFVEPTDLKTKAERISEQAKAQRETGTGVFAARGSLFRKPGQ